MRDEGKLDQHPVVPHPHWDCIKRRGCWVGRVILAIGSQTRDRFHPYSSRSIGGWWGCRACSRKVFFGECMEGEVYPKALTLPVDNLLLERVSGSSLDEALPTYTPKEAGFLPFHLS